MGVFLWVTLPCTAALWPRVATIVELCCDEQLHLSFIMPEEMRKVTHAAVTPEPWWEMKNAHTRQHIQPCLLPPFGAALIPLPYRLCFSGTTFVSHLDFFHCPCNLCFASFFQESQQASHNY